MNCIITGIALVAVDGLHAVAGDLFDCGTHYVFNGNWERGKGDNYSPKPAWLPVDQLPYNRRMAPTTYWERRGVFVIPKGEANLNQAAQEYLTK